MGSLHLVQLIALVVALCRSATAACIQSSTNNAIQQALSAGGTGAVVQLCQKSGHFVQSSIVYTAPNQEISTEGYPTDPNLQARIYAYPGTAGRINAVGRNGAKLLNVVVIPGTASNSVPAIQLGGAVQSQTVSQVTVSSSPSTCISIDPDSSNTCSGVKVTNSAFNFCNGYGIAINCKNSTVQSNQIANVRNTSIAILGGPGSKVLSNVITSVSQTTSRAGITLVDKGSAGNFANVVVSGNTIKSNGAGNFDVGIAVGSRVLTPNAASYLSGPASILNNVFVGNVGFSIVANGWTNGLTITGNNIAGVTHPSSDGADDSGCTLPQVQASFSASQQLIAYQPAITGTKNLQSNFASIPKDANDWACLVTRNSKILKKDTRYPAGVVADLYSSDGANPHGFKVQLQSSDGNLVGLNVASDGTSTVAWAKNKFSKGNACSDPSRCYLVFQSDGNLVEYDANGPVWASDTVGKGTQAVLFNEGPYFVVSDAAGNTVWSIQD